MNILFLLYNYGVIYMFIDTHCHLSKDDYEDIESVLSDNLSNGVEKIIISGCTRETILESIEIAKKYSDVFITIGYHPSEASIVTEDDLIYLEKMIHNGKVVGIGEIGLDYHYGKDNIEEQKNLFRKQMELALKNHLPVVIHSREATYDTINILKEFPGVKGDIHCFSGSIEVALIYISMGYKIGIGGVVTFKNSNLPSVVEKIGLKNILLETDSPYLTPEPFRGKKNSSKYLPFIAKKLADIFELPVYEIGNITTLNALSLFDLK